MKPIFCGNLEYDSRQTELERLFGRYGRVDRVDMKSGFAFIYMDDERDAEDAIRALDRTEFGRYGRRLRVEWTKQERGIRRPGGARSSANLRPTKTLFVINFDPIHTRTRDLERHFEPYGKLVNVRIRRNFAFIQFEDQEDATRALEATNMSKVMDRVISVEYAVRDDDERRLSPGRRGRDRSRSPDRGRGRSRSPFGRVNERPSPDYGHGSSPYRGDARGSPDYGRSDRPGASPDYGRKGRRRSTPDSGRDGRRKGSPDYSRDKRHKRSPDYDRDERRRGSPGYRREERQSPDFERSDGRNGKSDLEREERHKDIPDADRDDGAKDNPRYASEERINGSPNYGGDGKPNSGSDNDRAEETKDSPDERHKSSPDYDRKAKDSPAYDDGAERSNGSPGSDRAESS